MFCKFAIFDKDKEIKLISIQQCNINDWGMFYPNTKHLIVQMGWNGGHVILVKKKQQVARIQ